MDYRSDVYIKVVKEDEAKLLELLGKTDFKKVVKEYEDDDYVGMEFTMLNGITPIKMCKQAINSFIEEKSEYLRGLIVIGEDNDIEEHGSPYSIGLTVVSQIDW